MRLIDAEALMKEANEEGAYGYVDVTQIANTPTIEAKPVVHGRWEFSNDDGENFYYRCSHCARDVKAERYAESNDYCYCPYCNAQMDESEDKNEIF